MPSGNPPRWIVVNQSLSPAFAAMVERLAQTFGPAELWTGTPHSVRDDLVRTCVLPAYDRSSVSARARTWGAFAAEAGRRLVGLSGRPFVLAVTNPPFLPNVVWSASRIRGFRYGVLVWDLYPEHVVRMGLLGDDTLAVRAWRTWNRCAYRDAATVVTLGPRMADAVRAQGAPERSCEVIPNWADSALRPLPKSENAFAREHGLVDRTVVMYSGNLGGSHDLEPMLRAAAACSGRNDVLFVVVGDGLGLQAVRRRSEELGVAASVLRFLPRQEWSALPYTLSCADIAVVAQSPGTEHLSVPSKTYSALAVGSAVAAITGADSDLGDLVVRHRCGFVARDPDVFIRELFDRLDQPEALRNEQTAAIRASRESDPDTVHSRWLEVLSRAMASPR